MYLVQYIEMNDNNIEFITSSQYADKERAMLGLRQEIINQACADLMPKEIKFENKYQLDMEDYDCCFLITKID